MFIQRHISPVLKKMAQQFPVVAVMGPRQSGKTTLVRHIFSNYAYVTLEDLDVRQAAQLDPRGFLETYTKGEGVIIDEIQEAPELLSYMQGIVDQAYRPGFFVLTGSQHFLAYEKITQTLAGRIALLTLLPLSIHELQQAELFVDSVEGQLIKGFYPRLYVQPIDFQVWYANYISTYVEKDVRQVLKISDVVTFQRFLKLCAARVGNILNYSSIARDADISPNTAKAWISILETSYIIKLLYPYYKNYNKRVIKSPKLYFYDTGLICSLLGIKTENDLDIHQYKGAIFESFVISELFKYVYNTNRVPSLYFWRDIRGHEIDSIIEKSIGVTIPVEIKAGKTVANYFFKELYEWNRITELPPGQTYVVYAGNQNLSYKGIKVISWSDQYSMLKNIYQD